MIMVCRLIVFFNSLLFIMGRTESFSAPRSALQSTTRWLVVDFDGTCSERDTTPLLPQLAAVLHGDSVEERLSIFAELESEFFRRYAAAKSQMCPTTMSLEDALDSLDQVSNEVTAKVSSSGVLRGLNVTPQDICAVMEQNDQVSDHVRLRPGCAQVLAQAIRCRRSNWQLGVLSINWCPSLIDAALLQPIWQHTTEHDIRLDEEDNNNNNNNSNDGRQRRPLGSKEHVPIWSNAVDHDGVVSLQVPGALAKKDRILQLKASGLVVYIGDSSTDLAALVEADLGILIGNSKSTATMAEQWGINVHPLRRRQQFLLEKKGEISKVIWMAESWAEIQVVLNDIVTP
mmetsp:Transcript_28903/g.52892  ORF Transcript_28903/g.52892 Transcript_28903/m.52892 type:complete len:344 (+) Transcript_28903:106-1137(+)